MLSNLNLLHVDHDDAMHVLLRAQALPFEHFHNGRDLPHVGDGGFLDRHGFAFGTLVAHRTVSTLSYTHCLTYRAT